MSWPIISRERKSTFSKEDHVLRHGNVRENGVVQVIAHSFTAPEGKDNPYHGRS